MAAACIKLGAKATLVKGGHYSAEECVDILATDDGRDFCLFPKAYPRWIEGPGYGLSISQRHCLFSGKGLNLKDSVGEACEYLAAYIADQTD